MGENSQGETSEEAGIGETGLVWWARRRSVRKLILAVLLVALVVACHSPDKAYVGCVDNKVIPELDRLSIIAKQMQEPNPDELMEWLRVVEDTRQTLKSCPEPENGDLRLSRSLLDQSLENTKMAVLSLTSGYYDLAFEYLAKAHAQYETGWTILEEWR